MLKRSHPILCLALAACVSGADGLSTLHADIVSDYETVSHISSDQLNPQNADAVIILDIREPEEFAVSHIPGAIQIDPSINEADLLTRIPDLNGRNVVVYCSVGRRSSIFAERMQDTLVANGATSVTNLEEGIFGWHAEKRALVDADGVTDVVHPYDEIWKRYVPRQDKTAYVPE